MTKKLLIRTYGCQMNVYDSARMADVLAPLGFAQTEDPAEADMVILNTCHIREKAAEKVYSELGRLRVAKEARRAEGKDMILAVAGCVAQAEGEEVLRRAPQVDMVFGPQTYHRLPEMVARAARKSGQAVLDVDFPDEPKFDHLPAPGGGDGKGAGGVQAGSAFLAIQEGCDKFCSFCVVPYTRGAEYARPAADVMAEARALVAAGAVEITLLGQNVNAWKGAAEGAADWSLGRLIRELGDLPGLSRIRYTTSHPADVDDDLIAAHAEVKTLMPFLHLPVQSGSDRILQAMNRRHRADDYRRIVERMRRANPDLSISSDFIVGFPGETEQDFKDTLALVADVGFVQAYSFKYSPRPGTPAALMEQQVAEEIKNERLVRLQDLLLEQQLAFNQATVGRTLPVLLDRPGRRAGQLIGRSPYMQPVHVMAPADLFGTVVDLVIEAAYPISLGGRLADPSVQSDIASTARRAFA